MIENLLSGFEIFDLRHIKETIVAPNEKYHGRWLIGCKLKIQGD